MKAQQEININSVTIRIRDQSEIFYKFFHYVHFDLIYSEYILQM